MKHQPWIAPTVAILVVGSGIMDRINISFGGDDASAVQAVAPVAQTVAGPDPAIAALAAVVDAVPAIQNEQLGAGLFPTRRFDGVGDRHRPSAFDRHHCRPLPRR